MWWKCEIRFFQTLLRLKVWARSESEARGKIQRMYQISTIQHLVPAEIDTVLARKTALPQAPASTLPLHALPRSTAAMDTFTPAGSADSGHREYTSCLPKSTRSTPAWLLPKP